MKLFKKTSMTLLISLLLLTLAALPATATESTDVGDMISDATMELKVKTALLDKIGWDMLDTNVEAKGSHITLLGEAENKANCELAKEVALAVEGVSNVDNKLEIVEGDSEAPVGDSVAKAELEVKDAILESRVKGALIGEMGSNAFDLEVEASDGTVSLRGELSTDKHQEIALSTARDISGVEKVVDLISVRS